MLRLFVWFIASLTFLPNGMITLPAHEGLEWKYTTDKPDGDWFKTEYDDSKWKTGKAGFGTEGTPAARIGTIWNSSDIWMRREFKVDKALSNPIMRLHHDEDVQIFINGRLASELTGYSVEYQYYPLAAFAAEAVSSGSFSVAVHCHQTGGGQYIDVEFIDADDAPVRHPLDSALTTTWGAEVHAKNAWQEYPRPQMVRDEWQNLNGEWEYSITSERSEKKGETAGKILVPFCLESKLSGVRRLLEPFQALWYSRTFEAKRDSAQRQLLHFGAVDYQCEVWVNDIKVGSHIGGNIPFTFDISDAIKDGTNQLVVKVIDRTSGFQLRGKQTLEPRGIWYTRVSGIWQTVWTETVPKSYIERLEIKTDYEEGTIAVTPIVAGDKQLVDEIELLVFMDGKQVATGKSRSVGTAIATVPHALLWSPEHPYLYDLQVRLLNVSGTPIDSVSSYVGIRNFEKQKDADGNWRFTLNGEEIFPLGTLDQGWWPDGLLTPPSDKAIQFEIHFLKSAGFNMLRKHIKVEPLRYYYHCDRVGLIVWQDQVSGGDSPPWTRMAPDPSDANWPVEDQEQYRMELKQMMDLLQPVTCIGVWIPFNEAWGQHNTMEVGKWASAYDPTRLVNIASGGNFWPVGDVADHHEYPHPAFPWEDERFKDFIKVVGEFGGHGWPVRDHMWEVSDAVWGYGGLPKSLEELRARYRTSCERLAELREHGIAAGVYTQTTDVESEINGLMTYDRKIVKLLPEQLREMNELVTKPRR